MKHFSVFVHRQNALLNMFWVNIISHDSYKPQNVRQTLKQTLKDDSGLPRGGIEGYRDAGKDQGNQHKIHSMP